MGAVSRQPNKSGKKKGKRDKKATPSPGARLGSGSSDARGGEEGAGRGHPAGCADLLDLIAAPGTSNASSPCCRDDLEPGLEGWQRPVPPQNSPWGRWAGDWHFAPALGFRSGADAGCGHRFGAVTLTP